MADSRTQNANRAKNSYSPLLFVLRRSLSLTSSGIDLERDEFEQCCLEKAFRENLPVLGICRGAQLLNVALGGDLYEEVSEFYGEVGRVSTLLPSNKIVMVGGTLLERILGRTSLRVNSLNHQAIRKLGEGLRICAVDSAGVIQAVESTTHSWRLGVQWHPEYLPASRVQQRLFQDLVAEAASRKR